MADIDFAIQYVLRLGGAAIKADGKIGPRTMDALRKSSDDVKRTINMVRTLQANDPLVISNEELGILVNRVSAQTGVPASYLLKSVAIENYRVPNGFRTNYSGTYRGLGQFSRKTWTDLPRTVVGEYDSMTHYTALLALAEYYKLSKARFYKQGNKGVFTDEIAYLYHNQGPTGGLSYLRSGSLMYPSQSAAAKGVFSEARQIYAQNSDFV